MTTWPTRTTSPSPICSYIANPARPGPSKSCCVRGSRNGDQRAASRSHRKPVDKAPDVGQDGLLIAREGPVIGAVELGESRPRDMAGEMPAGTDANGAVAATVQHQGRNGNPGE